jgi:hypothetical protein
MCAMPTNLLIPGFLRAYRAAGRPRLPKLERMLARATRREPRHTHACLAALFGLGPAAIQPGPFMRLGGGGRRDDAYWLLADPVHLAPDRDQLVLMPSSVLEVQQEELQALADSFGGVYGAEGWHLEFPRAGQGYLRAPRILDVVTHDPEAFVGGPVLEAMPTGPDGTLLKQLMNETQMLFHTHPVNTLREETSRPAINSLWLWAGGRLPAVTGTAPRRILTDLPLLRGLAAWAEQPVVAPTAASQVATDDLVGLAAHDLDVLERDWFGPLFDVVKDGALDTLDIHLEGLGDFTLEPVGARRFWKRGRPMDIS